MTFTALTAIALVTATQSAHVHGHAEMAIAVESDGRLQIELTSPAYDFYGFEHAPRNDEQRATIEAADTTLRQGATLFSLIDGNCTFDTAGVSRDQDDAHDRHHHDGHNHENGHDHEAHHDHHAEHHHEDSHDHEDHHEHHAEHEGHEAEETHGNVRVTYSGRCAAPARISGIATTLFTAFPQLERVDGVFLSEQRQLAFELTPSQERARLPR